MSDLINKYRDKDFKYKERPQLYMPHTAEELRAVWEMIEKRKKEDRKNGNKT